MTSKKTHNERAKQIQRGKTNKSYQFTTTTKCVYS